MLIQRSIQARLRVHVHGLCSGRMTSFSFIEEMEQKEAAMKDDGIS